MRKHNEGYALPMVLVVMVVICIIAISVMSFSLRGLQKQADAIESMQAKYEAQGELEKLTAKIYGNSVAQETDTLKLSYGEDGVLTVRAADNKKTVWIEATLLLSGENGFSVVRSTNDGTDYYKFDKINDVKYVGYQILAGEVGQ